MFAGFIQDRELRKTRAKGSLSVVSLYTSSLRISTPLLTEILTVQEWALQ